MVIYWIHIVSVSKLKEKEKNRWGFYNYYTFTQHPHLLFSNNLESIVEFTWASTTVRWSEGEVNVFLGVETHHKRWNIDHLLPDSVMGMLQLCFAVHQYINVILWNPKHHELKSWISLLTRTMLNKRYRLIYLHFTSEGKAPSSN